MSCVYCCSCPVCVFVSCLVCIVVSCLVCIVVSCLVCIVVFVLCALLLVILCVLLLVVLCVLLYLSCLYCCSYLVYIGVVVLCVCVLLSSYVYLFYYVCIAVFTLDAGLLATSQYPEGPATSHLDIGFSRFPSVYKQMLRWFPRFQVATTCFSCSPPDLNLLVTNFIFCIHGK